jgi:hypothetical protein
VFRQGDVLVAPIDPAALPAGLVPVPRDGRGRLVLAYGEATGHAHVLTGDRVALLCAPDDPATLHVRVDGYGRLVHDEHGAIALPAGAYRVVRQREYAPGRIRPVAD